MRCYNSLKNHSKLYYSKETRKGNTMRNIYCGIADMRKRVFAEVARLAY